MRCYLSVVKVEPSCILTYDEHSNTLMSPNYPKVYGDDVDCTWKLVAPAGKRLLLKPFQYVTESGRDYLRVYDGSETASRTIKQLSGYGKTTYLLSTEASLFLKFTSDRSVGKKGFQIQYEATGTMHN